MAASLSRWRSRAFGAMGLRRKSRLSARRPQNQPAESAAVRRTGARAVVSVAPASLARVNAIAAQYDVGRERIGTVTRGEFRIQYKGAHCDTRQYRFIPRVLERIAAKGHRELHEFKVIQHRRRSLPRSLRRVRDIWPPGSREDGLSGALRAAASRAGIGGHRFDATGRRCTCTRRSAWCRKFSRPK